MYLGEPTVAFALFWCLGLLTRVSIVSMLHLSRNRLAEGEAWQDNDGCGSNGRLHLVYISVFEADFVSQRGEAFLEAIGNRHRAMTSPGTSDTDGQIATPLSMK